MITHHCRKCGVQVEEFCAEHPKAIVDSIVSVDPVKLTGETITDEQIRTEAENAWQHWVDTQHALGWSSQPGRSWPSAEQQRVARYRLAARINARNGAKS